VPAGEAGLRWRRPAPWCNRAQVTFRLALAAGLALALSVSGTLSACAAARPAPPPPVAADLSPAAARATLERFALAAEAGRWPEAWALLSPRWRAATQAPERLAADWRGAGPVAREAAARVVALLRDGTTLTGPPAGAAGQPGGGAAAELRLPVGPGRAARVVAEGGAWRVEALE